MKFKYYSLGCYYGCSGIGEFSSPPGIYQGIVEASTYHEAKKKADKQIPYGQGYSLKEVSLDNPPKM